MLKNVSTFLLTHPLQTRSKTDKQIKAGCNIDAIFNESWMYLTTSKLDQSIIYKLDQKLDQKGINRVAI